MGDAALVSLEGYEVVVVACFRGELGNDDSLPSLDEGNPRDTRSKYLPDQSPSVPRLFVSPPSLTQNVSREDPFPLTEMYPREVTESDGY